MNYPDDFTGTNMDCGKCHVCGKQEYTDDDGICGECNYAMQRHERTQAAQSPMSKAMDKMFSPGATFVDQLEALNQLTASQVSLVRGDVTPISKRRFDI